MQTFIHSKSVQIGCIII